MKKCKILIIDDEPNIIEIFVEYLSEKNYDIIIATDGYRGYEIAKSEKPCLIIMDWEMPVLNGIETIKMIKKDLITTDIPIIMATGKMLSSQHLQTALQAGAIDYLRKPIDPVELIARTNSILQLSKYHKQNIEQKNKEIAENTLFLIKNNEFNISVTKKLQQIKCSNKKSKQIVEDIINEIDQKVRSDSWQRFKLSFETGNKDFTKNLLLKFPTLSNTDLKLCIFLKLNMNSKDIATVLYNTTNSIKVARHRLRKKLELQPEQNLVTFLKSV